MPHPVRQKIIPHRILRILGSDQFFYGVLLLVVLQALWYTLSFHPHVNDEARHVMTIAVYSHYLSPFLPSQPLSWDHLGAVTRDGSFMFYYLMSWPLRLLQRFTADPIIQLTGLRLLCIAMFASGLVIYRRALFAIGAVPRSVVHVLFLFLALIPAAAILPATVNYDNMVWLIFAGMAYLAIGICMRPRLHVEQLVWLVSLGLFMSVVKWTAVALAAPLLLFVGYHLCRTYGRHLGAHLTRGWRALPRTRQLLLLLALAVSLGLFLERPVANVVIYGRPSPSCQAVIGPERCEHFADYRSYSQLLARKPANFEPLNPLFYFVRYWAPQMLHRAGNVLELVYTEVPSLKVIFGVIGLVASAVVLSAIPKLWRRPMYQLLLCVVLSFSLLLFIDQYGAYTTYGTPAAIRARYLIPVLPMAFYIVAWSAYIRWRVYPTILLAGALIAVLLMSQGGGIITYSLTTPESAYWTNVGVRSVDDTLRSALQHIVIR